MINKSKLLGKKFDKHSDFIEAAGEYWVALKKELFLDLVYWKKSMLQRRMLNEICIITCKIAYGRKEFTEDFFEEIDALCAKYKILSRGGRKEGFESIEYERELKRIDNNYYNSLSPTGRCSDVIARDIYNASVKEFEKTLIESEKTLLGSCFKVFVKIGVVSDVILITCLVLAVGFMLKFSPSDLGLG